MTDSWQVLTAAMHVLDFPADRAGKLGRAHAASAWWGARAELKRGLDNAAEDWGEAV